MGKNFNGIIKLFFILVLIIWIVSIASAAEAPQVRLKDLVRVQGIRENQLTGMGLVVGLNGTGDSNKASIQMVVNMLERFGLSVSAQQLKTKNVAAVMLTATLPPFLRTGDKIDVTASSFGDAKSLQGGILLQTPMVGADQKVYAVAQGPLFVGGYAVGAEGSQGQKNHPTVAILSNGALIEREVPMEFMQEGKFMLVLREPDFVTLNRLVSEINKTIGRDTAKAVDMATIEITIPLTKQDNVFSFIAALEEIKVTPDVRAKIIINEKTGTIIVGSDVKIMQAAVTHKNFYVNITSSQQVSQPAPLSNGSTTTVTQTQTQTSQEQGQLVVLPVCSTVGDVVKALNAVGATPQDIISILLAMKEAGALYAEIVVE